MNERSESARPRRLGKRLTHLIRAFGPQVTPPPLRNIFFDAAGVGFALTMIEGLMWSSEIAPTGLIAPMGASAVLIFYVSQGPFSQPWPVIVGNTISALVAVALVRVLPGFGVWLVPLAVTGSLVAMAMARAVHPPGGAVALIAAMAQQDDFLYALYPVAAGSVILVLAASLWGVISGRHYPAKL